MYSKEEMLCIEMDHIIHSRKILYFKVFTIFTHSFYFAFIAIEIELHHSAADCLGLGSGDHKEISSILAGQ
jgi:hypothetical protein